MKRWEITELSGRRLRRVTATFEPGLHVVLALDSTGTDELIPLLDGSTAPRHGRALLDGRDPYRIPELRRHIGSLWPHETLPPAFNLRDSLRRLWLEADVIAATLAQLESFGLSTLLEQPPSGLDPTQLRAVALALAMSKKDLWSLLLHEPFLVGIRQIDSAVLPFVLEQSAQIPVLIVTSSRAAATRLGGPMAELGGGFLRRIQRREREHFTLRIAGASLRPLASELVRRPRVRSLRMTNHSEGNDELWLETSDPTSISLDIVRIALQLGVRIWSMDTQAGAG